MLEVLVWPLVVTAALCIAAGCTVPGLRMYERGQRENNVRLCLLGGLLIPAGWLAGGGLAVLLYA